MSTKTVLSIILVFMLSSFAFAGGPTSEIISHWEYDGYEPDLELGEDSVSGSYPIPAGVPGTARAEGYIIASWMYCEGEAGPGYTEMTTECTGTDARLLIDDDTMYSAAEGEFPGSSSINYTTIEWSYDKIDGGGEREFLSLFYGWDFYVPGDENLD